jgi:hypothetical protein
MYIKQNTPIFGSRSSLLGRDNFGIDWSAIFTAAPCSAGDVATWVAKQSHEVLQGAANIW